MHISVIFYVDQHFDNVCLIACQKNLESEIGWNVKWRLVSYFSRCNIYTTLSVFTYNRMHKNDQKQALCKNLFRVYVNNKLTMQENLSVFTWDWKNRSSQKCYKADRTTAGIFMQIFTVISKLNVLWLQSIWNSIQTPLYSSDVIFFWMKQDIKNMSHDLILFMMISFSGNWWILKSSYLIPGSDCNILQWIMEYKSPVFIWNHVRWWIIYTISNPEIFIKIVNTINL